MTHLQTTSAPPIYYDHMSDLLNSTDSDIDYQGLQDQLDSTRLVIQKLVTPLVVLFGSIGNILNISILSRRWMISSINCYLVALAISDLMYLFFAASLSLIHYDHFRFSAWYGWYYGMFGTPLVNNFSNTGIWLTMAFTVERYLTVSHPFKYKRWYTLTRVKWIVIIIYLIVATITVSELLVQISDRSQAPSDNNATNAVPQDITLRLAFNYFNQTLFCFLPVILLLILNSLLIHSVMRASRLSTWTKSRRSGARACDYRYRNQQKVTCMLISVVVLTLVSQLPQAFANIYRAHLGFYHRRTPAEDLRLKIVGNVFNLLVMINCSANFIFYFAFNKKFRMTCKRIFVRCSSRGKSHSVDV